MNIDNDNFILTEMDIAREFCKLIHRARLNAGFTSIKYPVTDIKVNRYFLPDLRYQIESECNIVGYMDIPPIEYIFTTEIPDEKYYHKEQAGNNIVYLSTVRSNWQQEMFEERDKKSKENQLKKQTLA